MRAALVATLALLLVAAPAADAAFPGRNGKLVVSLDRCEFHPHLRALSIAGRDLGPLTKPCEVVGTEEEEPILRAARSPDWSPDGARLVFSQSGAEPAGLVTVAADGTDPQPIPRTLGARSPSFAPDGRQVAFTEAGAVWTVALDGSAPRLLRSPGSCPPNRSNCTTFVGPRWSPDGRRIAVLAEQFAFGPGPPAVPRPGIWLLDARTGKLIRRVVAADLSSPAEVDWSPDGRRLLFRTAYHQEEIKGGASGGNIWVVRADGRGRRRLVHRPRYAETFPRWSPDGRWIAWIGLGFTAGDVAFDVTPTVYRVRATGGRPQLVRRLPGPYVEEGDFHAPELAWQPLAAR
ncbi:MAG TPA: hypothetical protein VGW10_19725 [Solirubrobacteraceae bacterium]|nr:hypothetical protein [Solirubrobacteraceae bacterium]